MDVAVAQQFLNFFEDFIELCQWKNWPCSDTTEAEIRNAFIKSQHIEKCLDRFQKNNTLNEFLATLNCDEGARDISLKTCLTEPSKILLKKIINSNSKIAQIDIAFKLFLDFFSEEKLESYLTDIILEASSKDVLVKNMATEIHKDDILKFKSEILLSQITVESKEFLQEMLKNCSQDGLDLLVVSLCSTKPQFQAAVNIISGCILDVLLSKSDCFKNFWKLLFNIEDRYLIDMCVENSDLYTYMCEALIDCGKLLNENMSAEYFYIEFTYSELVSITRRLFANKFLKEQFMGTVNNHDTDTGFWEKLLLQSMA